MALGKKKLEKVATGLAAALADGGGAFDMSPRIAEPAGVVVTRPVTRTRPMQAHQVFSQGGTFAVALYYVKEKILYPGHIELAVALRSDLAGRTDWDIPALAPQEYFGFLTGFAVGEIGMLRPATGCRCTACSWAAMPYEMPRPEKGPNGERPPAPKCPRCKSATAGDVLVYGGRNRELALERARKAFKLIDGIVPPIDVLPNMAAIATTFGYNPSRIPEFGSSGMKAGWLRFETPLVPPRAR